MIVWTLFHRPSAGGVWFLHAFLRIFFFRSNRSWPYSSGTTPLGIHKWQNVQLVGNAKRRSAMGSLWKTLQLSLAATQDYVFPFRSAELSVAGKYSALFISTLPCSQELLPLLRHYLSSMMVTKACQALQNTECELRAWRPHFFFQFQWWLCKLIHALRRNGSWFVQHQRLGVKHQTGSAWVQHKEISTWHLQNSVTEIQQLRDRFLPGGWRLAHACCSVRERRACAVESAFCFTVVQQVGELLLEQEWQGQRGKLQVAVKQNFRLSARLAFPPWRFQLKGWLL